MTRREVEAVDFRSWFVHESGVMLIFRWYPDGRSEFSFRALSGVPPGFADAEMQKFFQVLRAGMRGVVPDGWELLDCCWVGGKPPVRRASPGSPRLRVVADKSGQDSRPAGETR